VNAVPGVQEPWSCVQSVCFGSPGTAIPTLIMKTLAQHAVEVIGAAWIVIVAVQYLSRYFFRGLDADFTWAYIGMLILTLAVAGGRLFNKAE
jgi:hypothetical protein